MLPRGDHRYACLKTFSATGWNAPSYLRETSVLKAMPAANNKTAADSQTLTRMALAANSPQTRETLTGRQPTGQILWTEVGSREGYDEGRR